MKIQVTNEDIKLGKRCSCKRCPVARALWRATGKQWSVLPTHAVIVGKWAAFHFTTTVTDWIKNHDNGRKVQPFEFDFDYNKEPNT